MKVTITSPSGDRITRYGVGDFQTNDDGTATLFYSTRVAEATGAPDEEQLEGTVVGAVDSCFDDYDDYYHEDLELELNDADDVVDYRIKSAGRLDA
jgi:hypothetical protein